ncbi:MAG: NAD(P)/FAD-dependent oxidoreductase [Halothiobacillaceae bacterium]
MPATQVHDVVIIGAGAAGLMCAARAAYRGLRVLVLDHADRPGKKILMSGGGRCNFTNTACGPDRFLGDNPAFCISALKRYSPWDVIELVDRHGLEYVEKAPGQLFCRNSAKDLLNILLTECDWAGAEIRTRTRIDRIDTQGEGFTLKTSAGPIDCGAVVVATGGLSIPTMGATGFGYDIARQFGLAVRPTRAGLVPFTLPPPLKARLAPLSGIATDVRVSCHEASFHEPMLITHRGLSGPAMLQISSYWQPGDELRVDLLPQAGGAEAVCASLKAQQAAHPKAGLGRWLGTHFPRRLADELTGWQGSHGPIASGLGDWRHAGFEAVARALTDWRITPAGTEGYRTAEVTLGGVDTRQVSSKDFSARDLPGLRFIGEVLDVTGQLGGHNFQWAWSSAVCCAETL